MKQYHIERIGFTGSAEELIHALHKASRSPADNDQTFMRQVAQRMRLASGKIIRSDDPENFVDDLVLNDMLSALVEQ
jgi:hypothetical protein